MQVLFFCYLLLSTCYLCATFELSDCYRIAIGQADSRRNDPLDGFPLKERRCL